MLSWSLLSLLFSLIGMKKDVSPWLMPGFTYYESVLLYFIRGRGGSVQIANKLLVYYAINFVT